MFLWKHKYKIQGPFPVPVFGNMLNYMMAPGVDHQRKRIEKYGDVFGGHSDSMKTLNVANIELLKKIMIKDYVEFLRKFSMTDMVNNRVTHSNNTRSLPTTGHKCHQCNCIF
ncbi:hypothetical protein MAR_037843, partial [Mya arenaria]